MPPVMRDDPYASYNFEVTVTGISDDGKAVNAAFTEVSGLEMMKDVIMYRNGNETADSRKIPGLNKYTDLMFKRGITGDVNFFRWVLRALNGDIQRTEGAIVLLDENRQEVMRWRFRRAWPMKFTGPSFNAKNSEIAMESLTLAHERLEIDI